MKELIVENMMCSHCENKIHQVLEKAGVQHEIDLAHKTIYVDDEVETRKILASLGYKVK